jgi:hypothetical protein
MKESGWKGFAQSLKRLSAAGRQKLLKLKFRWRGFISRLKEAMIDGWTMFGLLFLLLALSEKLPPFCRLFLLVFLLGLALLSVVLHYRFRQISSHALSLKPSESFRWEKVFNRMLSEDEKAIPSLLQILQARQKIPLFLPNPESLLAIFVLGRLKAQNAVEHLVEFLKAKQVQIDERVAAI